jgi:hypothetical protein
MPIPKRVTALKAFHQPVWTDLGVSHCGLDPHVAQERPDDLQTGTIFVQVRCKRAPKNMRRDVLQACSPTDARNQSLHRHF